MTNHTGILQWLQQNMKESKPPFSSSEITLSKPYRAQVLTLVTATTVGKMLKESELTRETKRTWARIEKQVSALLAETPKYGMETLGQLTRATSHVWGCQNNKGYDAITMLNLCLWLVEGTRIAIKDAAEKRNKKLPKRFRRVPPVYMEWSYLAGSLFTLSKHLGAEWVDHNDRHQVEAVDLGIKVLKAV